jgi:hypothetical protein
LYGEEGAPDDLSDIPRIEDMRREGAYPEKLVEMR